MLALTAGQAFAQRCLPQMKGIEVKVGMADGVYNGKKSCKAGYYAGLGLSSYTKGGDKWTYGAEYLQVHQPYRETSVPMAQMTGEFGYSYNFLSDNSKGEAKNNKKPNYRIAVMALPRCCNAVTALL